MKFYKTIIKRPSESYVHYSVWPGKTNCGINLTDKQFIRKYTEQKKTICPKCQQISAPSRYRHSNHGVMLKDLKYSLRSIQVLSHIINDQDRGLLGLLEYIEFNKGGLSLFINDESSKILDLVDEMEVQVSYNLDNSIRQATISYHKMKLFRAAIIESFYESGNPRLN